MNRMTLKGNKWNGWRLLEENIVDYIVFKHNKEGYCNLYTLIDDCRVRFIVDLEDLDRVVNNFNWIKSETCLVS